MKRAVLRRRELRRQMTEAEYRLWRFLRDRNLCGVKFRHQHAVGRYIVDFACPARLLIIELDGNQHKEKSVQRYHAMRSAYLRRCGWRVIRFRNHQVLLEFDAVMEEIYRLLRLEE